MEQWWNEEQPKPIKSVVSLKKHLDWHIEYRKASMEYIKVLIAKRKVQVCFPPEAEPCMSISNKHSKILRIWKHKVDQLKERRRMLNDYLNTKPEGTKAMDMWWEHNIKERMLTDAVRTLMAEYEEVKKSYPIVKSETISEDGTVNCWPCQKAHSKKLEETLPGYKSFLKRINNKDKKKGAK